MNFGGEKWHLLSGKEPVITVLKAWGVKKFKRMGVLYIDKNTFSMLRKIKRCHESVSEERCPSSMR